MGSLTCGVKKFHLTNIVAHIIYPHMRTFSVKTDGDNSFDDHGVGVALEGFRAALA